MFESLSLCPKSVKVPKSYKLGEMRRETSGSALATIPSSQSSILEYIAPNMRRSMRMRTAREKLGDHGRRWALGKGERNGMGKRKASTS